jgi:hypothetical protein
MSGFPRAIQDLTWDAPMTAVFTRKTSINKCVQNVSVFDTNAILKNGIRCVNLSKKLIILRCFRLSLGYNMKLTVERIASQMIGWDNGEFQIQGGRKKYHQVDVGYHKVKLTGWKKSRGVMFEKVTRYVNSNTILEFDADEIRGYDWGRMRIEGM